LQEITVDGRRLNEVRTSEVGATVSQHQIENVPQITRNFMEFADTIPGVVFEVDGSGRTNVTGGAQSKNGVNLYIDGVGQKGYVQLGREWARPAIRKAIRSHSSRSANTRSSRLTTRRKYDQISSAAITALTRSGTE
jgi:outer membrane receptor protein involved in Fe transport